MDNACKKYLYTSLSLALITKLIFAAVSVHPGIGDPSYYYTLAENLTSGRGFVIDYIGHYLTIPEQITHYCNDYWMPLTSTIIALFMLIFGQSLFVALLPSIIASLLIALVTYNLAMHYTKSAFTSAVSAGLVVWAPTLFSFSLIPDSITYYILFAICSIYFLVKSEQRLLYLILSSIFCGLTHLTRQDGMLLFLIIITFLIIAKRPGKIWKNCLLATLIYILVLSPLMILNWLNLIFIFWVAILKSLCHP